MIATTRSVLLCLLVAWATAASAAEEPFRTAADRSVDIQHIKLDLDVSLKAKRIAGTATIDFAPRRPLDVLELDAVHHQVESVTGHRLEGESDRPLTFVNTGEKLVISFPQPIPVGERWRVEIGYAVEEPQAGLYFFQPTDTEPDVPYMVWSQGEPISNRYWIPCLDHPNERQTTELLATVDAGFEVLSNGKLFSRQKTDDGRVRFHWKESKPHAAYLVTLVVGKFAVGRDEWRGKPVLYYAPPDRADDIQRTFRHTPEMLEFFSNRFGIEYPWEKYAQVAVEQFIVGGMENTSATTLYDGVMHDERALLDDSPDWLIAHEMGHQWWGDLVTCKDWAHLWLNEGFATYCDVLWAEHDLGPDERDYRLYDKSRSARSGTAKTRPIVDRRYPRPSSMFDARVYPKGGWVLHMLRSRLGDEDFFRALQQYGTQFAYKTAETSDLRQVCERVSGLSLERFFHDWTGRPGHPELTVKTTYQADDKLVKVQLDQTQDAEAFQFPFRAEFVCPDRTEPVVLSQLVSEKTATFFVPVPSRPTLVRIDPRYTLLADWKEEKSRDWWTAQLQRAPTVPERLRAVEHFGASKQADDRKLLIEALNSDSFYGVRIEAAKALGKSGGDVSRDALIAGLKQEQPKVRRACAKALGEFTDDKRAADALHNVVTQGDPSYFVQADAVEALGKIGRAVPVDLLRAQLDRPSHAEVIRRAALAALGRSDKPEALDLLLAWTRRGKPRSARRAAIAALPTFLTRNDVSEARKTNVVDGLTALLAGEGPRIRQAAVQALGDLGSTARPALDQVESLAAHDPEGRVRESAEQATDKIRNDAPLSKEVARLRKQIEDVRKENRQLEEKLLKLEAK